MFFIFNLAIWIAAFVLAIYLVIGLVLLIAYLFLRAKIALNIQLYLCFFKALKILSCSFLVKFSGFLAFGKSASILFKAGFDLVSSALLTISSLTLPLFEFHLFSGALSYLAWILVVTDFLPVSLNGLSKSFLALLASFQMLVSWDLDNLLASYPNS